MKPAFLAAALALAPHFATAQTAADTPAPGPDVELWRLDCGPIEVPDIDGFSDSFAYHGQSKTLTNSCYLIRHGRDYMLWDTGLPLAVKPDGSGPVPTPGRPLVDQLAEIDVTPDEIGRVGISHAHFDHMGQAAEFPAATLTIGAGDWDQLRSDKHDFGIDAALAQPWLDGGTVDPVTGYRDVFGDGSVTMLAMPGHTHGETALLVRLAQTGPVLLSGDVVHFSEQLANEGVPPFNVDRADSLASMHRLESLIRGTGARLVIQHEATHVGRLPAFPGSAR